jgi:hypothetical protein
MNQPDLFTGDELRDFGIAAAEASTGPSWSRPSTRPSRSCAAGGDGFTAEDVRAYLGQVRQSDLEDVSKVIGGRIRAAAVSGLIYTRRDRHRRRPSAHSRRMLVWYGKGNA